MQLTSESHGGSMSASTTTVLGKRKTRVAESLLIHLSASESNHELSDQSYQDSEPETPKPTAKRSFILVNGSLVQDTKKKYRCTFGGCEKVYTKPCRLEEHERSHTGERPFVCTTCNKSYLRETHLQAHARSHLSESDRPLECSEPGCGKRFWTAQHLKVHEWSHKGEKPWKCTETGCTECFLKHHQLRAHLCTVHAPVGTRPYQCNHTGCTKSFSTSQKLRAHTKTHDEKRYTCSHSNCISTTTTTYYPTWTSLQSHIRTTHPPMCPYPQCQSKTFTQQKGLKAHLKLHEEWEDEERIDRVLEDDDDDGERHEDDEMPKQKRRGGEYGRDWKCQVEDCGKDFKSKKALNTHHNISHLGKRDFVCPHEDCGKAYGYKHLLQRHLAKAHSSSSSGHSDIENDTLMDQKTTPLMDIDTITGKSYVDRIKTNGNRMVRCPYPLIPEFFSIAGSSALRVERACEYAFSRAYDLRRHLRSEHAMEVEKEVVDEWVRGVKHSLL